jgi:1-deoxy-D-xylulose-5-phosphate synthase
MLKEKLLSQIESPADLKKLTVKQLEQVAREMRDALCNLVADRTAHFASNLGVIELCLALHTSFDFRRDRLIWDTGHQIYPHKMVTGRFHDLPTMRMRGGLMGYPNPEESEYDLFMTGHAGCSISTVLGMKTADDLLAAMTVNEMGATGPPVGGSASDTGTGRQAARGTREQYEERRAVAVIGDGALPSGIVFEALNNAGGLKKNLLVVLNDNKMSICPRVGGLGSYLDRLRSNPVYKGFKHEVSRILKAVPLIGDSAERALWHMKEALKAGLQGGMLFEELGFRYVGPVDGHNIASLRRYFRMVQRLKGPVLLHVMTQKGQGFRPAEEDPVFFHTPAPFARDERQTVIPIQQGSKPAYTNVAATAIQAAMQRNPRVTVLTAAMCQGNKLDEIRDSLPERFFDVGICESHAVAFAAGQAKAGLRPIVAIYSTFLQRSFDQLFQEVALQNLPVTFMLDRAGVTGPDGPTHHGMFDQGYLRLLPNMTVMAPGDAEDLRRMLDFALAHDGPVSIRYPKASAEQVSRDVAPVELGRAEILRDGGDGVIVCCGALLANCLKAAEALDADGLDVGVVNARFVKPLDTQLLKQLLVDSPFVVTVEEAALIGGFGSAVLEFAADAGLDASRVRRLGIPDRFVEHGERGELLAALGLDAAGIAAACREAAQYAGSRRTGRRRRRAGEAEVLPAIA